MATNVIFGSGIVGLLAKNLLAGDWTIVPFSRSRYYSFNPPLADNFISRDAEIDGAIKDLTGSDDTFFYRRSYSVQGQLVKEHDDAVCSAWLSKIFGANVPGQSLPYMTKRLVMPIYRVRVNLLYQALLQKFMPLLKEEAAKGPVTEIGANYFIRGGVRTDFDHLVSTIPLPTLVGLAKKEMPLKSRDEHFVLVKSSKIDLEGCNQSLVVDPVIDFFKVTALAPQMYMFYFLSEVLQPGAYLLPIIGHADVIDGTKIGESIPVGEMPDLKWLEDMGIFSVGSQAQWDWCADVGSNLLRLIRYAARGYVPAKPTEFKP